MSTTTHPDRISINTLIIGLETAGKTTAKHWMQGCFERGVLTLTAGAKSLRLAPPLTLGRGEAEIGFGVMRDVLLGLE